MSRARAPLGPSPATRDSAEEVFAREPRGAMYVPREATEKALHRLVGEIEADTSLILLTGPPGLGKSLILRRLAAAAQGRVRCLELSAAEQPLEKLEDQVRDALAKPEDADRDAAVRARQRLPGNLVLLVLDDCERLPEDGLARLRDLAAGSEGRLQILAAACSAAGDRPPLRLPDRRVAWIELSAPMGLRETFRYVRVRLARAVAPPEVRRRFGPLAVARLWHESEGNPERLHVLARRRLGLDEWDLAELPSLLLQSPEPQPRVVPEAGPAPDPAPSSPAAGETPEPATAAPPRDPSHLRLVAEAVPTPSARPRAPAASSPPARSPIEPKPDAARAAALAQSESSARETPRPEPPAARDEPAASAMREVTLPRAGPLPPEPAAAARRESAHAVFGGVAPVKGAGSAPDWLDDASVGRLLGGELRRVLAPVEIRAPRRSARQKAPEEDARSGLSGLAARLMTLALFAFLVVCLLIALDVLLGIDMPRLRDWAADLAQRLPAPR